MIKKVISMGSALLALGIIFGGTPAFAVDDSMLPGNNARTPQTNCIGSSDMNCSEPVVTSEEIPEPGDEPVVDCIGSEGDIPTDCGEGIVVAPTEEEIEIQEPACATEDGEGCEEAEEANEPATWPMYVSLGALGLAVVVFIILNLFGGKKK